jgi:hypothetical protein
VTPGPSVPVGVAFGCRNAAPVITRPGEETKSPAEAGQVVCLNVDKLVGGD